MPSHQKNKSAPVHLCRRLLKEKISSLRVMDDLDSELSQVSFLMERTVNASESDSVLIIGPPGCGKTMLVKEALQNLKTTCDKDKYISVQLNGLIHTDDNLALRDIIHQMNVVFDGTKVTSNFSENLQLLLHSLRNGEDKISKAVIFVLEEFHLFCAHRNQTLLYNLFDTVQSTRGVCVIGLTSRLDVAEMLEKRVKSRYSHRQILLLQPATIEKRMQLFKELLILPNDRSRNSIDSAYRDKWNKNIESLAKDNRVIRCVQRQLELDGSESGFRVFLMLLVCQLDVDCPSITSDAIHNTHNKISNDDKITLLEGLSVLEICLIIAMSHQNEIYDGDPFNFEMIANRYMKFASQNSSIQIMQRPVLLKAFERIKHLELISPVSSAGRNSHKEFQLFNFLLTKEQVTAAVNRYSGMPTDVTQWASSSLM
ncbi:origin recognition complex subunit 4 [Nilaparvata lugens]|uniref:origin recognition complex subunit 4 n=1 Tax=Nilaparvata lugens TaxID=108931 RepID=UPI00193E452C|nr:origin recognition complex subunit 4 [Nilaparvata lugens]XP_039301005.1 origin recognition complex subunit 4 [Nilaparvata lugens]